MDAALGDRRRVNGVALGVLECRDGQTGLIAFDEHGAFLGGRGRDQLEEYADGLVVVNSYGCPLDETLGVADTVVRRSGDGGGKWLTVVINVMEITILGIRLIVLIKGHNASDFKVVVRMASDPAVFEFAESTVQVDDLSGNIIRCALFIEQSVSPFVPSQLVGDITRSNLSANYSHAKESNNQ